MASKKEKEQEMKKKKGQRRFFFHYNKPESGKKGRNVLTLHWKGKCHLVNKIICYAPTETHDQKNQPRCVVRGWAAEVNFRILRFAGRRHDTAVIFD